MKSLIGFRKKGIIQHVVIEFSKAFDTLNHNLKALIKLMLMLILKLMLMLKLKASGSDTNDFLQIVIK